MPAQTEQSAKDSPAAQNKKPKQYVWGLGRRKTAVARVRIAPGEGNIQINRRTMDRYFTEEQDRNAVRAPLIATDCQDRFDVWANVRGGGPTGQAGAIRHALSRALVKYDEETHLILSKAGCLTRDSRKVERKKYGQPGARKRYQFSKR